MAEIANAENKARGAGAARDVSRAVPDGVSAPGAATKPFPLQFRYLAEPDLPRDRDDVLGLYVKVFASQQQE